MDLLDKVIAKAIGMPHKPLSRIVFWLGFIVDHVVSCANYMEISAY